MSTKKVSDATAKRRLLQLAELLESERVEGHFNFCHWGATKRLTENDPLDESTAEVCGTTACALGWAPALPFAKRLGIELYVDGCGGGFRMNGRKIQPERAGKILFGVNQAQFGVLFYPGGSPFFKFGDLAGNAKPSEVAANIRKFVHVRFG